MSRESYLLAMGITPWHKRDIATEMDAWLILQRQIKQCQRCILSTQTASPIMGIGDISRAKQTVSYLIITDTPLIDATEKILLNNILFALQISPMQVYITSLIKCTGYHRDKKIDKDHPCIAYVLSQIEYLRPQLICLFGEQVAQIMTASEQSLAKLRGIHTVLDQYTALVSDSLGHLLQYPQDKQTFWYDIINAKEIITSGTS